MLVANSDLAKRLDGAFGAFAGRTAKITGSAPAFVICVVASIRG